MPESTHSSRIAQLQTDEASARRRRIIFAILVLVTFCTFADACCHEFTIWDDNLTIWRNPHLNPPSLAGAGYYWLHAEQALYIPVTYTVWSGLAAMARLDLPDATGAMLNPWVFHTANVVLHALTVLAVFALLERLVRKPWAACVGALFYGLHPLQVEAVCWASGTKDVLAGLFCILALWQYFEFAAPNERKSSWDRPAVHYGLATVFFVMAMLSKPSAVMLPVMAAAIDWGIVRRPIRQVAGSLWPWFVLSGVCVAIAAPVQASNSYSPLWARPAIACDAITFYLFKLVWPARLVCYYGHSPSAVIGKWWLPLTAATPCALGLVLLLWRRARVWIPAAAIFVAGLLPNLGLKSFQFQYSSTVADHYVYVAMLGPALAIAWALSFRPGRWMYLFCCVILAALAVRSAVQTTLWRNGVTLFGHNVELRPDDPYALNNLAASYSIQGDLLRAAETFERAIAVKPDYLLAHENLAQVYLGTGRPHEAIAHFYVLARAESRFTPPQPPERTSAHRQLGKILMDEKRYGEAIWVFGDLLRLTPGDSESAERLSEARKQFEKPQ